MGDAVRSPVQSVTTIRRPNPTSSPHQPIPRSGFFLRPATSNIGGHKVMAVVEKGQGHAVLAWRPEPIRRRVSGASVR